MVRISSLDPKFRTNSISRAPPKGRKGYRSKSIESWVTPTPRPAGLPRVVPAPAPIFLDKLQIIKTSTRANALQLFFCFFEFYFSDSQLMQNPTFRYPYGIKKTAIFNKSSIRIRAPP